MRAARCRRSAARSSGSVRAPRRPCGAIVAGARGGRAGLPVRASRSATAGEPVTHGFGRVGWAVGLDADSARLDAASARPLPAGGLGGHPVAAHPDDERDEESQDQADPVRRAPDADRFDHEDLQEREVGFEGHADQAEPVVGREQASIAGLPPAQCRDEQDQAEADPEDGHRDAADPAVLGVRHRLAALDGTADGDAAAEFDDGEIRGDRKPEQVGTFNRLIFLGDTYLELIGVWDRTLASGHPIGAAALAALDAGTPGLVTWAIATDGARREVVALRAAGSAIGDALPGERIRQDGGVIRWHVAAAAPLAGQRVADRGTRR